MTMILALVGLLALVAILVVLLRTIATDGYGTRSLRRAAIQKRWGRGSRN